MKTSNEDGDLIAMQVSNEFIIKIRQKSDWSLYGYSLNKEEANDLIAELKRFLRSK